MHILVFGQSVINVSLIRQLCDFFERAGDAELFTEAALGSSQGRFTKPRMATAGIGPKVGRVVFTTGTAL